MIVKGLKKRKSSSTPFLKHKGQTPEEQLNKNQSAMQLLRGWLEQEVSEEESQPRETYFESFKKTRTAKLAREDQIFK